MATGIFLLMYLFFVVVADQFTEYTKAVSSQTSLSHYVHVLNRFLTVPNGCLVAREHADDFHVAVTPQQQATDATLCMCSFLLCIICKMHLWGCKSL